jgi:phosphoglycolate phosphatase
LKLIIFDFDGTLVDSRSLILESHRIVFAEFQLPAPSPDDSLALVGKSLDVILTQLAGPTAPILEMVKAPLTAAAESRFRICRKAIRRSWRPSV